MLRGFATVNYWANDLEGARKWYAELLGIEPYFERPGYYKFRVGDYEHELGLVDSRYAPASSAAGPGSDVLYWHVDDLPAALQRLLSMGAKPHQPVTEWGTEGFVIASVVDPFGNILGIMYNPHYVDMLGQ